VKGTIHRPACGRGPGLLLVAPKLSAATDGRAAYYAEEGYVALTTLPADAPEALARLARDPGRVGRIGAMARREAGDAVVALAGELAGIACYDYDADPATLAALPCPAVLHFGERAPDGLKAAVASRPDVEIYTYKNAKPGFADRESGAWNPYEAGIAYSRTLALLRRALGPHFNLSELWDRHLECEFVLKDATENMKTMVAEPYVNHVPTMTGGVGHDLLKRFYTWHFIHQAPPDRRTIPVSRTVGPDRVIEEKVFCFTHTIEMDWLLPGVKPTGRYIEIPLVVVVSFRGDKLYNEHIYWDQASVLAQAGLLDPKGLPVAGAEQARKLLDKTLPSNTLMPAWPTSEGKPV
jgi:carboxymethylenebutenolidase